MFTEIKVIVVASEICSTKKESFHEILETQSSRFERISPEVFRSGSFSK